MALESITCGIVHHACQTRAHCPTMVLSFKLSSGTVCLLGFSCRAGHIRKGKYKICGSYQVQDCTGRNGIVHHAHRMTRCCNISSLGQMALESTTYGIVHHVCRTRAHCLTMVSSFKLSSGTVCLLGFSCRAGHIRKGKYKICGSYQVQDCTGRNGIVHHACRMIRCCNISSLGQMALESTTCGIVHHARRTQAHCLTMVSSFKLSSGTVCLLGFSCRAGHIRKGKYKICGSYQVQDCTGRNGIVHHARRMTRCYNISSLGQMALESTTCGIVHHTHQT